MITILRFIGEMLKRFNCWQCRHSGMMFENLETAEMYPVTEPSELEIMIFNASFALADLSKDPNISIVSPDGDILIPFSHDDFGDYVFTVHKAKKKNTFIYIVISLKKKQPSLVWQMQFGYRIPIYSLLDHSKDPNLINILKSLIVTWNGPSIIREEEDA